MEWGGRVGGEVGGEGGGEVYYFMLNEGIPEIFY